MEAKRMKLNCSQANNGNTPDTKNNGLHLYPVAACDSGEGLPYAPEDWPKPGDKWSWKVGRRTTVSGFFLDRKLYLPSSLVNKCQKHSFNSRLSVEQYIQSAFPGADINAFFALFSWQIPAKQLYKKTGDIEGVTPSRDTPELSGTESHPGTVTCKAGNHRCSSLMEEENTPSELMPCDICCSDPRFCQHCCCILCSRTICSTRDNYSYIKCEARVDGGYICGHIAHIDCGLRAYMAGTVGGCVGLDAEYYCRRCDSRTDLISHVAKLVKTCETVESEDDIQRILNAGIRLLQRSNKASAQKLLHHMKFAVAKLKKETQPEDIWKREDISSVIKEEPADNKDNALASVTEGEPSEGRTISPRPISLKFDPRVEALKLEDEIDQVLLKLRKSQEYEFRLAEERLLWQKDYVQTLFNQVDKERFKLSRRVSLNDSEASVGAVLERLEQLKNEFIKLKDMKRVVNGFGRTPKHILKEHFYSDLE